MTRIRRKVNIKAMIALLFVGVLALAGVRSPAFAATFARSEQITNESANVRTIKMSLNGGNYIDYPVEYMTFQDAVYYWYPKLVANPPQWTESDYKKSADGWMNSLGVTDELRRQYDYYFPVLTSWFTSGMPRILEFFYPDVSQDFVYSSSTLSGFDLVKPYALEFFRVKSGAVWDFVFVMKYPIAIVNLETGKRKNTDWELHWRYTDNTHTKKYYNVELYGDFVNNIDWNGDFFGDILDGLHFGDNYKIMTVSNVTGWSVKDSILRLELDVSAVDLSADYPIIEMRYGETQSILDKVVDTVKSTSSTLKIVFWCVVAVLLLLLLVSVLRRLFGGR